MAASPTTTENERRVLEYWDRVWTRGDAEHALAFYAPTFDHDGEATAAADFAAHVIRWRAHFEGFGATVERLFACGDDVVVSRVTYRGRHVGDFVRVPATGREVEATGIDVFVFRDGRCVEHLHEADHYTMFVQLGAPPTPEAPPAEPAAQGS